MLCGAGVFEASQWDRDSQARLGLFWRKPRESVEITRAIVCHRLARSMHTLSFKCRPTLFLGNRFRPFGRDGSSARSPCWLFSSFRRLLWPASWTTPATGYGRAARILPVSARTVGANLGPAELYAGYDHTDIGGVTLSGPLLGARAWFRIPRLPCRIFSFWVSLRVMDRGDSFRK